MRQFLRLHRRSILSVFVAVFLPALFTLLWIIENDQLPGNDASNYLLTAVNIYQHFADHGIWNGLTHLYGSRGWRPIFYPDLIVPFLLISHGSLYFAYAGLACCALIASVTYAYLYFRLLLERSSAILAASLIGLLPLLQAQFVMFYAEGILFACLLGSFYHLIKSNYLRDAKHSFAFVVLLSLALIIRPVEALTQSILVLMYFLLRGYFRQIFSLRDIYIAVTTVVLACAAFFAAALIPMLHFETIHFIDNGGQFDTAMSVTLYHAFKVTLVAAAIVLIGYVCLNYRSWRSALAMRLSQSADKPLLLPVVMTVTALVMIWYLPFAFETYQWIYRTSLGDVATSTGALNGSQFSWAELQKFILAEGAMAVYTIVAVGLAGSIMVSRWTRQRVLSSMPIMFLLLSIPFSFWETFYTVQVVTRKLSFAFPALLMAFLLIGLQRGRAWPLRISLIAMLVVLQFSLMMNVLVVDKSSEQKALIKNTVGYFIPKPQNIQPNPHLVVRDFLDQYASNLSLHSIGMEVDPGTPDARHPVDAEPIDPFLFSTMLVTAKSPYVSGYPYISAYTKDSVRELGKHYDAIFLSDHADKMLVAKTAAAYYNMMFKQEKSQSLKTYYDFMRHYAQNSLHELGWKQGPCIIITTQKHGDYRGCLLLK